MKTIFSVLILFLLTKISIAQYTEFGVNTGASFYSGDLIEQRFSAKQTHAAVGIFLRSTVKGVLSARLGFMYGSISGDDQYAVSTERIKRNLNFKSDIQDLHVMFDLNLIGFNPCKGRNFSPYLTGGAAVFHFDPISSNYGNIIHLQPLGTEGEGVPGYNKTKYSLFQLSIPMGGGFKYAFTKKLILGFEFTARKTFTDYLDDVSGNYVDLNRLAASNGTAAAQLSYRGAKKIDPVLIDGKVRGSSPTQTDWYYFGVFSLSYIFRSACDKADFNGRTYIGKSRCFDDY